MFNIPSARLTVPKAAAGEIVRGKLIDAVLNSPQKTAYVHAGAGYGKTTLLAQAAIRAGRGVWLSLDGENDVFTFVNTLCAAVRQAFPTFGFAGQNTCPFPKRTISSPCSRAR